MSKPSAAERAAMAKMGGIVQGVVSVFRFLGREDDGDVGVASVVDAVAERMRGSSGVSPEPSRAPAEAPPLSRLCPLPQGRGWHCLLHRGHTGDCVAGRDEDDR